MQKLIQQAKDWKQKYGRRSLQSREVRIGNYLNTSVLHSTRKGREKCRLVLNQSDVGALLPSPIKNLRKSRRDRNRSISFTQNHSLDTKFCKASSRPKRGVKKMRKIKLAVS